MFERIRGEALESFEFTFDGERVAAQTGDTVASALLAAGKLALRETPTTGTARGPFCMMGVCFDCLVRINGETVQGCMVPAMPGLEVVRLPRPEPVE